MKNRTYCVIMAGGIGARFWPLSQESCPKQFLDILGTGKTLIQQTFERLLPICPAENFIVVTSEEHKSLVLEQLPQLHESQVLSEPARRNTAPCIAYANAHIRKRNPNALVIVSPSDHLITNEMEFQCNISKGLDFVEENDVLLTLGIKPNRPETGYGYIQIGKELDTDSDSFRPVKTFTEKPNLELAKVFYESGEFYWNSGIFIWSLKTIDAAFANFLAEIHSLFQSSMPNILTENEPKTIHEVYMSCKNISIDYGIMEKANNVFVQMANFGWSDLGTWTSLHDYSSKDTNNNGVLGGQVLLYDTQNSIVHLPSKKIAVIQGLNNYIIVEAHDSLLICPKSNEQQIRQFVTDVKTEFGK
ncbi:MAG: mannose-1-phosphate guanylyltransferase [Breznakibacter sp.]